MIKMTKRPDPEVYLEVSPRYRVVVDERTDCWVVQKYTRKVSESGTRDRQTPSKHFRGVAWVNRRDGLSGLLKSILWHAGNLVEHKTYTGEVRTERFRGEVKEYPVALVWSERVPLDDWFPGVMEKLT